MNTRHKLLAVALLATLAAVFWPHGQGPVDEVVAPARRPPLQGEQAAAAASRQPLRENAAAPAPRLAAMQADLFPRQTWVPPPPPPPKPPPPPPPKPPALPFTYIGRWMEGNTEVVFLDQGGRTISVKPGQILPGAWRVEEITRGGVVFTYLPLDMQSTLGIKP
jgi:hypothetical protein